MKLSIHPRETYTWDRFVADVPANAIALDWFVSGGPMYNPTTKHINFDHHTDVQRLATRSTTGQVQMAIKQWLFDAISYDDALVYINDADQDVCLSTWLLKNYTRLVWQKGEPLLHKLIEIQDKLDVTSGMYPFNPELNILQTGSWIFDPYVQARMSNRIHHMKEGEMRNIIESIHSRIDTYLQGNSEKKKLDTEYVKIWGGNWWTMVKESWYDSRLQMAYDGIKAFVSVKELENNKYAYSLGKLSEYIPFPIQQLFDMLNELEAIPKESSDRRGWGTIIGGSPRNSATLINPNQIESAINEYLSRKNIK